MPKKTHDPVLIALKEQQEKAFDEFERWYSRTKRAFTHLDKVKKKLVRLARRIEKHLAQPEKTDA